MFKEFPDIMTVTQVAEALGIGKNKAYELVKTGVIISIRLGRRIIVPKIYLIDYIKSLRYNSDA
ncbi:MAG TPA: helix-turn-helix domain-containing protein [Thermoanaerobacterales bacterium]|jgi:excisionase family DNA binding protein|nr:helix-turn-helix domain-containing protein [Thermoanaerobacterales bacterium]